MTEMQKQWLELDFEELIGEHLVAASNERLWAKGAPDQETAEMHEQNAEEHFGMVEHLRRMKAEYINREG
jgi:hypothetical protein